jgi:peptide/nickel transport system permease protein
MAGTGWFAVSRMVRAETLSLRDREFVLAARALGVHTPRLLVRMCYRTCSLRRSSPRR